jgi:putative phosphoserine phosphatase/1-acylglycerol-3-phosphate O-acyltransferase
MGLHDELTREIDSAPEGPQIGAFFDLDRTLIAGFSAEAFAREWMFSGRAALADLSEALAALIQFQMGQTGFSAFVGSSTVMLRGLKEDDYRRVADDIFTRSIARNIYPESRALVEAHLRRGHTVGIISSATRYQVEPVARELGITEVMATDLVVDSDGRFTGEVHHPTCYGTGKAYAAENLAAKNDIDLSKSYFYSDSDEDLPLMLAVGNPRPTNPNARLESIAAKHAWPVRHFTSRGTPSLRDIVRTGLTIGSMIPSLAMGIPAGLLDGRIQSAVNLAFTTWGEVGSSMAGIHINIEGEEHLWSNRPAVFIFNHQSALDTLLLCKLLRRDFVGIGKEEIRGYPVLGQAFALAGTIFIDRLNPSGGMASLAPAVEALREGMSIAIAPEGTRSLGPHVGAFKKGAFRIAKAAGAPIVPIIIHNALDALPKHALIVRPATINVTVLPPIFTAGWDDGDLDDAVFSVRRDYLETLAKG